MPLISSFSRQMYRYLFICSLRLICFAICLTKRANRLYHLNSHLTNHHFLVFRGGDLYVRLLSISMIIQYLAFLKFIELQKVERAHSIQINMVYSFFSGH